MSSDLCLRDGKNGSLYLIPVFRPTRLIPFPSRLLLALQIVHWLVFPCGLCDRAFKIDGHFSSLCGLCLEAIQHITFSFILTHV